MRITTLATQNISRWVSGEIRFTPKEKELLTQRARQPGGVPTSVPGIPARGKLRRRSVDRRQPI